MRSTGDQDEQGSHRASTFGCLKHLETLQEKTRGMLRMVRRLWSTNLHCGVLTLEASDQADEESGSFCIKSRAKRAGLINEVAACFERS